MKTAETQAESENEILQVDEAVNKHGNTAEGKDPEDDQTEGGRLAS